MKGKKLIEKICYSYINDWEKRRYLSLFLKSVALIIALVCTAYLLAVVLLLIVTYKETIAEVIGMVVCIGILILGFGASKKKKDTKEEDMDQAMYFSFDPVVLESTYYMIRNNIGMILCETADLLKLRKPAVPSQMDLPTHCDIIWKTPIYHLMVRKTDEDIDVDEIKGILQTTIQQKADNHELDGIPANSTVFCNGMKYPILMVDAVRDRGDWVQIDLAITTNDYIKYRDKCIYDQIARYDRAVTKDKDF